MRASAEYARRHWNRRPAKARGDIRAHLHARDRNIVQQLTDGVLPLVRFLHVFCGAGTEILIGALQGLLRALCQVAVILGLLARVFAVDFNDPLISVEQPLDLRAFLVALRCLELFFVHGDVLLRRLDLAALPTCSVVQSARRAQQRVGSADHICRIASRRALDKRADVSLCAVSGDLAHFLRVRAAGAPAPPLPVLPIRRRAFHHRLVQCLLI